MTEPSPTLFPRLFEPLRIGSVTLRNRIVSSDPVHGLLTALEAPGAFDGEVHGIGDCLAPRTVEKAVLEGLRVASGI